MTCINIHCEKNSIATQFHRKNVI